MRSWIKFQTLALAIFLFNFPFYGCFMRKSTS